MKFETMSVVVGSEKCNARCPYCIAKMSGDIVSSNWKHSIFNFEKACRLAANSGVTTCLLTGKGEPTLFPDAIADYVSRANKYFPLIELQTNGLVFADRKRKFMQWSMADWLLDWREHGLNTIALSVVHWEDKRNQEIYTGNAPYPPLVDTIDYLHSLGYSIRLSCVGLKDYVDSRPSLKEFVEFAYRNNVEQVTWRPVTVPENSRNEVIKANATALMPDFWGVETIKDWANKVGNLLFVLPHGAKVFNIPVTKDDGSVGGQNLCLSNCMTHDPNAEMVRQIIYCEERIRFDWQYEGAIIL